MIGYLEVADIFVTVIVGMAKQTGVVMIWEATPWDRDIIAAMCNIYQSIAAAREVAMVYPDMMWVVFNRNSIVIALFNDKISYNDVVGAFDLESADDGRIDSGADYAFVGADFLLRHGDGVLDKDYVWFGPADIIFQFSGCCYSNGVSARTACGAVKAEVVVCCPTNRPWVDRQSCATLKYDKHTYN